MSVAETRARYLWPAVSLLAVLAYGYSLGGLYIPHIGDEAPYIEITRLTANSGDWLPLRTGPGLENTKPPGLFWLGIVATRWAESFTLLRLRLPIVLFTFATAGLTFFLAHRIGGDREESYVAALTFLGFHSSFQYGRPFLTNLPETLFVLAAFAVVWVGAESRDRFPLWLVSGLGLGVACLFKSFALIAPVGLALAWYACMLRSWNIGAFLRYDAPKVAGACVVALACFLLWPALDPAPGEIFRHFVLEENVGKLGGSGYVQGLFTGPYPLWRLWLGHFGNAGLFVIPLAYLVLVSVRERRELSVHEKGLWILVLSFLIVYSVPSQRQENYLLPTVPALAILLARRWRSMGTAWFRSSTLPAITLVVVLISLIAAVRQDVLPEGSYALWQRTAPVLALAGWLIVTVRVALAPFAFHALVFATYLAISAAMAPFEGPAGRFDPDRVQALAGQTIFVPESFIRKQERHRFLLPGTQIEGYDPLDTSALARLLETGRVVVIHRGLGETRAGPFRILARRLELTSRHTVAEVWRIAVRHELDLLVRQELVVRRFRLERERQP